MANTSYLLDVELLCSPSLNLPNYKGKALAVSSINKLGRFDILPFHTNFITLIFNELTRILPNKKKKRYEFKQGVLEVNKNKVKIFIGV